jgi:hypothetical protein
VSQPFLLWWGNPERELPDKILGEDIREAITSLPPDYRLAVVLRDFEGESYLKISELLQNADDAGATTVGVETASLEVPPMVTGQIPEVGDTIEAGDVVYFAPGERHWHGAGPGTFMVHIAITPAISTEGGTDWLEPVTDEEYSP